MRSNQLLNQRFSLVYNLLIINYFSLKIHNDCCCVFHQALVQLITSTTPASLKNKLCGVSDRDNICVRTGRFTRAARFYRSCCPGNNYAYQHNTYAAPVAYSSLAAGARLATHSADLHVLEILFKTATAKTALSKREDLVPGEFKLISRCVQQEHQHNIRGIKTTRRKIFHFNILIVVGYRNLVFILIKNSNH